MGIAKVSIRRLPSTNPPIPDGGGRIMSEAGELAQILNGPSVRFLAYLEFRPEATLLRGNHYHREKTEMLYILTGRLRARYTDLDSGESMQVTLGAGDFVTISPRCAHAYRPLEHTQAIEMASLPYDPADTVRHEVGSV